MAHVHACIATFAPAPRRWYASFTHTHTHRPPQTQYTHLEVLMEEELARRGSHREGRRAEEEEGSGHGCVWWGSSGWYVWGG